MEPLSPNLIYHIYNHGNGDDLLFRDEENYRYFLQQYQKHIPPVADTLAWCLMPNHFHLLVKIKQLDELNLPGSTSTNLPGFKNLEGLNKNTSKQFSNLFNGYTKAINKRYSRRGSLFIKNFNRKEITSEIYFQQVIAYIHLNPVKHGFVNKIKDWPWTSYQDYFINKKTFIHTNPALKCFGTMQHFMDYHELIYKEILVKRSGLESTKNQ